MYGGARYPAPAVVGGFGGAIGGSMNRSASLISSTAGPRAASRRSSSIKRKSAPADSGRQIEVYRGTKSDQVKVGGYGR
jgi:pilus assembly protein CpaB